MQGAVRQGGHLVSGRYRLEGPIGHGAMGIVWRARDELLDRAVAVKEVRTAGPGMAAEGDSAYQRTLREAKAAARLNHPGVVTVFDVVEEDGSPWIVMELVPARSLDRLIAEDGPLRPGQAAQVGADLLGALACAHTAGVLHRDVKPGNVLLVPDGRAVLTDFGIATFDGDPALTQAGMVVGTPGFTAPERIRGNNATPASDLWSLGATLYAAVEGRGPFDRPGGAAAITAGVIGEDAPPAPSAGTLGPVIRALLRADPGQRPDADEAARLLADAAAQAESGAGHLGAIPAADQPAFADLVRSAHPSWLPPTARPGEGRADADAGEANGPGPRRPPGGRRARRVVLAAAAAAVALAAAGLVAWSARSRSLPAGYRWYQVSAASSDTTAGFEIAVPTGWLTSTHGLVTDLRPATGNASVEISLAAFTYPRPRREVSFRQAQALEQDQYPGYRLLGVGAGTFRGVPDATWRFSREQGGVGRVDVLMLLATIDTTAGTQSYALTVSAPRAGFPAAEVVFRRELSTFQPLS